MTMHDTTKKTNYATAMKTMWKEWLNPADSVGPPVVNRALARKQARQNRMSAAITAATSTFMTTPDIRFVALGADTCGSFSWPSWRLRVNASYFSMDDIEYEDFLELCVTGYHETRHAEQFFRVAQGLAAERLTFPDRGASQVVQAKTNLTGLGSVSELKAMFEKASTGASVKPTPQVLSDWLNIPINVATQASTAANARFTAFLATTKPTWFRRSTIHLEVEDWMRECYKTTLGDVAEWAQGDEASYEFYKDQPTETDAHGIEDDVKSRIETKIGVAESGNEAKKRDDVVFNSL